MNDPQMEVTSPTFWQMSFKNTSENVLSKMNTGYGLEKNVITFLLPA